MVLASSVTIGLVNKFSMLTFYEADVFFYVYLMPIREACRQIIGKILRET